MFVTSQGVPVLGEFTPWSGRGTTHCVVTGGLGGEPRDACSLGRLWWAHGQLEGGNNVSVEAPAAFRHAQKAHHEHGPRTVCRLLLSNQDPLDR
jgi:hypothetical protein